MGQRRREGAHVGLLKNIYFPLCFISFSSGGGVSYLPWISSAQKNFTIFSVNSAFFNSEYESTF